MAYINDYSDEYGGSEPEVGSVLSHPNQTKTIYMVPGVLPLLAPHGLRIFRGDLVVPARLVDGYVGSANEIVAFDMRLLIAPGNVYSKIPTAILGVALADADYSTDNPPAIPVAVAGDVIATIYAGSINSDGRAPIDKGKFYAGEYIGADGVTSGMDIWEKSSHMMVGQILAPKQFRRHNELDLTNAQFVSSRLYRRESDGPGVAAAFYHVPVRLTLSGGYGGVSPGSYTRDARLQVYNPINATVQRNQIVSIKWEHAHRRWIIYDNNNPQGNYANAMVTQTGGIEYQHTGEVMVAGQIYYEFDRMAIEQIANSTPARLTSLVAKAKAAVATNSVPNSDIVLEEFYPGMRVTDRVIPIVDGVPDNQFAVVTDVIPSVGNDQPPVIYFEMNPVSTHSPGNEADTVLDVESVNVDELPVGTSLIENPITHMHVPCRFDTDNVDGVVVESTPLPTINGWGLAEYRALYGPGVYQARNGTFWNAVKRFGKGVYQKVIRPVGKWAVDVIVPIVASKFIGPLGHVVASAVTTQCDQLLNKVESWIPTPSGNGMYSYTYRNIQGELVTANDDDPVLLVYADCSGSYKDTHPNQVAVVPIDAPSESNTTWELGDCFKINATSGKAEKISSYEDPIVGVVNWEPAQEQNPPTPPENGGWRVAGITKGFWEIQSANLHIGDRVLYDGTSAENRIGQGLKTAVMGKVREVWQPSAAALEKVAAGKLSKNDVLPNCIVEVDPEVIPATGNSPSPTGIVMARNMGDVSVSFGTPVSLVKFDAEWQFTDATNDIGDYANGVAIEPGSGIAPGEQGRIRM